MNGESRWRKERILNEVRENEEKVGEERDNEKERVIPNVTNIQGG